MSRGGGQGRFSKLAGNAGWNLADQILSTLSNAGLTVVVAQLVDAVGFGAFMTALLVFSLLIAVERALVGQVLSIRHSAETRIGMRRVAARALGTVLTLAVPAGAVVMLVGVLLGGALRGPLLAVGLLMAPLLLQDTCRHVFFAQSRARRAAMNDLLWTVVQVVATAAVIYAGAATPATLILAWGGSAAVAAVVAMVQLHAMPHPGSTGGWLREHRALLAYLLPEALTTTGGDKASVFLVGGLIGEAGLGAVSGARQVLNPLQVVTGAAVTFTMPEVSRRVDLSPSRRRLIGLGLGGGIALMSLVYVGILVVLPDAVGNLVFRASWSGIKPTLLPMGLFSAFAGCCVGPFIVIAAMGHAKRTFRLTILATILQLALMPLGGVLDGAPGAAWGMCLAKALEVPFWIYTLSRVVHEGPAAHSSGPGDGPAPGAAEGGPDARDPGPAAMAH